MSDVTRGLDISFRFEFPTDEHKRRFDMDTSEVFPDFMEFQAVIMMSCRQAVEGYLGWNNFEMVLEGFEFGPDKIPWKD